MGLGKFLSNAAKSAGKVVSSVTKPIGDAVDTVTSPLGNMLSPIAKPISKEVGKAINAIQSIPVLGQAFNIYTGAHFIEGAGDVLKGRAVDKTALNTLKKQVKDYKAVAPYAASIVAFVPGIGTGIAAGISAASALAEGQPLTQVGIEAVKGAIPGGAIAQSAFSVTQAAAAGKPVDQVAIAALPVTDRIKQALITVANLTKELANGKKLDKALLNRIDDAVKVLTPEMRKAVTIGSAVGIAQKMQEAVVKAMDTPAAKKALAEVGRAALKTNLIWAAARSVNKDPAFQSGFDLATGILQGKFATTTALLAAREHLSPEQRKGFDAAAAFSIGYKENIGKRPPATTRTLGREKVSVEQKAGYLMTLGIAGAAEHQKVGLVKELSKNVDMRTGAVDAIKQVASARDQRTIWDIIKQIFGFGPKQLAG